MVVCLILLNYKIIDFKRFIDEIFLCNKRTKTLLLELGNLYKNIILWGHILNWHGSDIVFLTIYTFVIFLIWLYDKIWTIDMLSLVYLCIASYLVQYVNCESLDFFIFIKWGYYLNNSTAVIHNLVYLLIYLYIMSFLVSYFRSFKYSSLF